MCAFARSTIAAHDANAIDRAVRALIGARRTHNRLDWWQPEDWLGSYAWTLAGADGALLIIPTDADDAHTLNMARSDMAWLRWCAVADGHSASGVMRSLFAQAAPHWRARGITSVWAIADATDWVAPYLGDAGFERADRMLTYQIALTATERWTSAVAVRPIDRTHADELACVIALDEIAFDAPWRYGQLLRRAFNQCQVFVVAMNGHDVLGYACAVCEGERGHVVRLAVASDWRGRGIGTTLLKCIADEVRTMVTDVRVLSLNTQQSNAASQRLYARLGFHMLIEQPFVFRLALDQAAS